MTIEPPKAGEDVDKLWRYVVELTQAVNALLNATVEVNAVDIKSGKVVSGPEGVKIILE